MIKFFKKIRLKLVRDENLRKYFLYALGEIILIVFGILIALQLNTWNEERKAKIEEIKLLNQLYESLELEVSDVKSNIQSIEGTINSIGVVRKHLEYDLPYHDSLGLHFATSSKSVGYIVNPAVYENLKSKGLNIITNDNLRNKIVSHYDYVTSYLKEIERIIVHNYQNSIVDPFMIKNFDYSWSLKPAFPMNYEELIGNSEYLSILKTGAEIKAFQLNRTRQLLKSAGNLQTAVTEELKRTE